MQDPNAYLSKTCKINIAKLNILSLLSPQNFSFYLRAFNLISHAPSQSPIALCLIIFSPLSLLDQIKLTRCKSVVAALQYAKSRAVKRWRELDMRITDAANEAKDNVKYLYTLDQFFGPLGTCDPVCAIYEILFAHFFRLELFQFLEYRSRFFL